MGEVGQVRIHLDQIVFGGSRIYKNKTALPAMPVIEKTFLKKILDLRRQTRQTRRAFLRVVDLERFIIVDKQLYDFGRSKAHLRFLFP
jgi:hypothetical protein